MRFGSREAAGVSPAQALENLNPPSLWLPEVVDTGPISAVSTRTITTVTGGVANTKGSYTTIISSTAADADWLNLHNNIVSFATGTNTSALLDIAVGAAASEVDIVPNVAIGYNTNTGLIFSFPVRIPKGSRVSCRVQGAQASKSTQIQISLSKLPVGAKVPSQLINYGADTGTSQGVTLATPGANNTKGAWTEIAASTSVRLQALLACPQANGGTALSGSGQLFDIGMGGAGSEVVIPGMENLMFTSASTEGLTNYDGTQPMPCNLPRGTRLSARFQTTNTGTNGMDLVLIGVPK